jgi:hypothetical protein
MTPSTTGPRRLLTTLVVTCGLAALTLSGSAVAAERPAAWTGTWGTAVTGPAEPPIPATFFADQTLRQVAHVSVGGRSRPGTTPPSRPTTSPPGTSPAPPP